MVEGKGGRGLVRVWSNIFFGPRGVVLVAGWGRGVGKGRKNIFSVIEKRKG